MTLDYSRQIRMLERYRFIFRTSLVALAFGLALTVIGVGIAMSGTVPTFLGFALLLVAMAIANAWRSVCSAVRIMEGDPQRWFERV